MSTTETTEQQSKPTRNEVWVFIEQRGGKAADVSFELLSKGYKLAQTMNGVLKSVVIGHNVKKLAEETFRFGADEALLVDDAALRLLIYCFGEKMSDISLSFLDISYCYCERMFL
jgi:electron transfer flavoprotein alpha subunit